MGLFLLMIVIICAALYIAVLEPVNKGINDAAGPVVGKTNGFYDSNTLGYGFIFGIPLLIIGAGFYFYVKVATA